MVLMVEEKTVVRISLSELYTTLFVFETFIKKIVVAT